MLATNRKGYCVLRKWSQMITHEAQVICLANWAIQTEVVGGEKILFAGLKSPDKLKLMLKMDTCSLSIRLAEPQLINLVACLSS